MQIHGPSVTPEGISVRLNPGSGEPFAVIDFGPMYIYVQSIADADELITAAVEAKRLLLGETGNAAPGLDATLSPPATDARDADGTPPGHQLPAGKVPGHFPAECGRTNAHFPHGACGGTVPRDGEHVESVQAFSDAAAGTDAR